VNDAAELLSLEALEPFGWIFTPGPLPPDAISATDALEAAGVPARALPGGDLVAVSGSYTEKGRYRQQESGSRVTLYYEFPVWVVTSGPGMGREASCHELSAEHYSRHTLVDARSGKCITQFLLMNESTALGVLDLHEPLSAPEMTMEKAVAAAIAAEERVLTGLPRTAEYGSRWRLIPGFVQVTDVWRVTFDTSSLPPLSPAALPEVAWVVMVDDKAGHRWLSAALEEPRIKHDEKLSEQ
jgi:hypothetical protein